MSGDDWIQTFGTGQIQDLNGAKRRKRKQPIGFAPPKPKTAPRKPPPRKR